LPFGFDAGLLFVGTGSWAFIKSSLIIPNSSLINDLISFKEIAFCELLSTNAISSNL
jgi:hypothetical protein